MNNVVTTLTPLILLESSSFLQVTRTTIKSKMGSKFGKFTHRTAELAALRRLEKSPYTYNGENVVTTLLPSFLDGSSFFADFKDNHLSLDEFKFCQDPITDN